uniref:Uncharacterized protein n=1 Tax=Stegastes partitus TaxID=144197 RepID=A0A3B5B3Z6_9TELE
SHFGCFLPLLVALLYDFPKEVKEWVDLMQKDLITLTDSSSGIETLKKIYRKHRTHFSVETNNARELVATAAGNIEKLLNNRSQALKVSVI